MFLWYLRGASTGLVMQQESSPPGQVASRSTSSQNSENSPLTHSPRHGRCSGRMVDDGCFGPSVGRGDGEVAAETEDTKLYISNGLVITSARPVPAGYVKSSSQVPLTRARKASLPAEGGAAVVVVVVVVVVVEVDDAAGRPRVALRSMMMRLGGGVSSPNTSLDTQQRSDGLHSSATLSTASQ